MIAAGEVVERPASVVKELIENAIDAGAKSITAEIRGGGMSLVRVTDDGCGMSPEDAGLAFQRHATSKLRGERDLESIATLGFRGEALAAIASVSRIELLTRARGSENGTRVTLAAGEIEEMGPAGCPEGTVLSVRDLFHNTPARLKFMKSDKAEGSACAAMALRCALGHPEISMRMIRDGQEMFFTPGDGKFKSAVYSLLGRDNAMNMLDCSGENGGVRISGCVTAPHAGRGNRAMQFFFINGRPFKSAAIQAALEQAYKNTLLTGRFPGCVLYIELPFARVDVNVHPAKTEVKFTEEKTVFDAVYYAVLSALGVERGAAELRLGPAEEKKPPAPDSRKAVSEPRPDFYKSMSAEQFRARQNAPSSAKTAPARPAEPRLPLRAEPAQGENYRMSLRRSGEAAYSRAPASAPRTGQARSYAPAPPRPQPPAFRPSVTHAPAATEAPVTAPAQAPLTPAPTQPASAPSQATTAPRPFPPSAAPPAAPPAVRDPAPARFPDQSRPAAAAAPPQSAVPAPEPDAPLVPDFRVIGEAMNTYIIVEWNDSLLLIDKHAAHERMIFDALREKPGEVMSQNLIMPVTFSPGAGDVELILGNLPLLRSAGFEIEPYGQESVIIRAVPADTDGDERALLEELCEKLRRGRGLDERRDAVLHTIACKAAIKAGWRTDERERRVIAEKVLSGQVRYCPHGRPVCVKITHKELDKQFKRIN